MTKGDYEAWQVLPVAIVAQAVEDYWKLKRGKHTPTNVNMSEIRGFFLGEWIKQICPMVEGRYIWLELEKRAAAGDYMTTNEINAIVSKLI